MEERLLSLLIKNELLINEALKCFLMLIYGFMFIAILWLLMPLIYKVKNVLLEKSDKF